MTPLLTGVLASQISGHLGPSFTGSYDSLATVTLASNVSSVVFDGIPQNYRHLELRATMLTSTSGAVGRVTVNGDVNPNYYGHYLYGNPSSGTVSAGQASPTPNYGLMGYSLTGSASYPASFIANFADYRNPLKFKVARTSEGGDGNGTSFIEESLAVYKSYDAISSLTLTLSGGTFNTYSQFSLYGIK